MEVDSGIDLTMMTPPPAKVAPPPATGGNTSLDTGVSSDLSESRPSLNGDDSELSESGCEYDAADADRRRNDSAYCGGERKRRMDREEEEEFEDEASAADAAGHWSSAKRPLLQLASGAVHPATAPYGALRAVHDLADIPAILHLASSASAASAPAGHAHAGEMELRGEEHLKEQLLLLNTSADEYRNEEDDPFSASLREMKLKGEFPCRLCDAVFPNLRALKGELKCPPPRLLPHTNLIHSNLTEGYLRSPLPTTLI